MITYFGNYNILTEDCIAYDCYNPPEPNAIKVARNDYQITSPTYDDSEWLLTLLIKDVSSGEYLSPLITNIGSNEIFTLSDKGVILEYDKSYIFKWRAIKGEI